MLTLFLTAFPLLLPQDLDRASWARVSQLDRDGDGRVTRQEFPRRGVLFRRLDRDGNGFLSPADFGEEPAPARVAAPGPADPEGLALFESEVLPILKSACFDCHSESARRVRGELKVDSLAALLEGGVSGPAILPGDPEQSMLVEVVRYLDQDRAMPPDGELAPEEVSAIERWVALGAPWPGQSHEVADVLADMPDSTIDIDAGREWWSFKPVVKPDVPEPRDSAWVQSPIDAFLLARLEEAGLEPVEDATGDAWLRRVTFDLTGLPPTPEELEAFPDEPTDEDRAQLVDRLLASPRYAERWGRHWLDVARYAESSGRDSNVIYPHAWRYRDWVIEAFERDLPYDQFLAQQLAGDLIPADDEDAQANQAIATGYLALGPKSHNTRNPIQFTVDVVDEQIDAISQGMLGLTVACARCHDHKFDPIPTEDYYSLAGILGSTRTLYGTHAGPGNLRATDLLEVPAEADVPNGPDMPVELRRYYHQRLAGIERVTDPSMQMSAEMDPADRFRLRLVQETRERIEDILSRWDDQGRALPDNRMAMGASEGRSRDARVLLRGEIDSAGEFVPRGFPQVLCDGETPLIRRGSGRLELAEWVASEENPLTARVWANRVWSHLFGTGIVASPNNFGMSGQAPTHPGLLDWLAATLVEEGWSTKELVRQIVLSHAYQLSTAGSSANEAADPTVSLLWRMPARRLEAEAMRDSILFVAGSLDLERPVGSPVSFLEGAPRQEEVLRLLTRDEGLRSVYMPALRDRIPHALECFDAADPSFVTGDREETIVATQALYLMNDEDVMAAADAFARRILRDGKGEREAITSAFLLALSREPTASESSAVRRFLSDFTRISGERSRGQRSERAAWSAFAQSLFQSAEFRYRG